MLLSASVATADTADDHLERAREFHDKGDFTHARDELLAAYQLDPRPELLFALGQVELNLGHDEAAIDYYQRFLATNPDPGQAALAQQAIGAARMKRTQPPPPPPPPPPKQRHRDWDINDWGLAGLGGAAIILGTGLLVESRSMANDRSGTLSAYDDRLDQARTLRIVGGATLAAGALTIGAAVLRWRFHLVETQVEVHASPDTVGVTFTRPL